MSILRDVIDLKDSITDSVDDTQLKSNLRNSIAKEASPGILQFPVLTSTTLSLSEVTMLAKALEREYVSFISVITSIDAVTDEKSVHQYLQRLHQNFNDKSMVTGIRESSVFGLPMKYLSKMNYLRESEENALNVCKNIKDSDGKACYDEDDEYVVKYDDLEPDEKDKIIPIIKEKCGENKCYKFANDNSVNSVIVQESNSSYKHLFIIKSINSNEIKLIETVSFQIRGRGINKAEAERSIMQESIKQLTPYVSDLNMDIINEKTIINDNYYMIGTGDIKNKYSKISEESIANVINKEDAEFKPIPMANRIDGKNDIVLRDVLKDNDVKKANELVPTMMHLKTYFKDKNGSLNAVDYLIGVKTVVHSIDANSMIDNLVKSIKRGKGFFNLMRLTTGELSFFKDFVFAVGRIKDDIHSKYKDNPWWSSLISRKKYAGILKVFNFKQQLVPNATIVISMEEVEKIKMDHNIDIMDLKTINDIMTQLFLLGFVIVDSSVETAYFMFDGQRNFQQYSFNALERENSNSAKEIQNVMQVLGRM